MSDARELSCMLETKAFDRRFAACAANQPYTTATTIVANVSSAETAKKTIDSKRESSLSRTWTELGSGSTRATVAVELDVDRSVPVTRTVERGSVLCANVAPPFKTWELVETMLRGIQVVGVMCVASGEASLCDAVWMHPFGNGPQELVIPAA
jgi:hypothetical protein